MNKFKLIINIILLILWMGVIFNFSNDNGEKSSSKSERFLIKIAEIVKHKELTKEEKEEVLNKYSLPIRKCAHMFVYFVLGIISYLLLHQFYGLQPITIIYTLIFCFIYACTDEIHQLFINGRSGQFLDVLIDTCGTLISLIIPTIKTIKNKKMI